MSIPPPPRPGEQPRVGPSVPPPAPPPGQPPPPHPYDAHIPPPPEVPGGSRYMGCIVPAVIAVFLLCGCIFINIASSVVS